MTRYVRCSVTKELGDSSEFVLNCDVTYLFVLK